MEWSNKNITTEDVKKWTTDFINANEIIKNHEKLEYEVKQFLTGRIHDALFLVAFVESQFGIYVDDDVYDRARELQERLYRGEV